jgi:phospholipase C
VRGFKARVGDSTHPVVVLTEVASRGGVSIELTSRASSPVMIVVRDAAYGATERRQVLRAGARIKQFWSLESSAHWYDLEVRVEGDDGFLYRFAGHVENGRVSSSDPAAAVQEGTAATSAVTAVATT